MSNLSTEQKNIIKKAKDVKGEQRQFTKFIQEEVVDKGYQEFLSDNKFIMEMEKVDKRFKTSIEFLNKKEKDRLREYFVDGNSNLIISEEELALIPEDRSERYDFAKRKEDEGNFDMAKRLYKSIMDLGEDSVARFMKSVEKSKKKGAIVSEELKDEDIRISTYYKSKFSYYMCKVKNQEKLTKKEKKEINEMLKEDRKTIRDLLMGGADIEFIMSVLGEEIKIEKLEREILPNIKENKEEQGGIKKGDTKGEPKTYFSNEELLDLFKDLGEIKKVTLGKDGLDGFVLFTYENITIAEKFFKRDYLGDMVEDRASTYLVHKRAKLDLEKATKGELVESKNAVRHKKRGEKLLDCSYHSIHYKDNLRKKYRAMDGIEFDKDTGEIIVKERKIRSPKDTDKKEYKRKNETSKSDITKKTDDEKADNKSTNEAEETETSKNEAPFEEVAVDETEKEEPAVEEPTADETEKEEPAVEEPTVDETEKEEPAVEEPTADETEKEELAVEEPTVDETEKEELAVEEPTVDETEKEELDVEARKNKEEEMLNKIEKVDKENEMLRNEKEKLKSRMREYFDIIEMVKEERAENVRKSFMDKNVKERIEIAKKILLDSQAGLQQALKGMRDIDKVIKQNKEERERLVASYEAEQDQGLDEIVSASINYLNGDESGEGRDE